MLLLSVTHVVNQDTLLISDIENARITLNEACQMNSRLSREFCLDLGSKYGRFDVVTHFRSACH